LAHEKSVARKFGKLLDELEPYAASLSYDSNEASLLRVARRDFEKAIKVPSGYVARVSEFGATAYDAWRRARPANDFATMVPFLEMAIELGREYADFFAPYEHVADPLIDDADEGMTTASIRTLFAELRNELVPIVGAICNQPAADDGCLRGSFGEPAQLDFGLSVVKRIGCRTHASNALGHAISRRYCNRTEMYSPIVAERLLSFGAGFDLGRGPGRKHAYSSAWQACARVYRAGLGR
jgi:carboxypeptidase Taq